tara:strand:+ start:4058 stop:5260 length:1203 start_codon:yes stop_codon:yes gene_type:complete
MNKLKLIGCAFSIMPLLTTLAVNAQTTDLVEITVPDVAIEKEAVHFSQRISSNKPISFKAKGYTSVSDEYWFEATGKQLKVGVDLAISSPGALVRLSGKQTKDKYSTQTKAIDPNSVQLFKNNKKLSAPFSQKVSQQEFATANIFPNSSAMKLNSKLGKGAFTLKVNEYLDDNQRYIVNVKEKNAEHKLHLSLAKQSYMQGQTINFTSQLKTTSTNKALLTQGKPIAYIKMPSGKKSPLNFTKKGNQFQFTVPTSLTPAKRGQLFELYVETENTTNGLKVKRNAKVAFAVAQPTARIETVGDFGKKMVENQITANFVDIHLQVASEGRYEVSAMIYGSTSKKLSLPFMLSRSAYYLTPGEHTVKLKLDTNIIKNSGLKAPYTVKNVRLMDQSRMALLQQM